MTEPNTVLKTSEVSSKSSASQAGVAAALQEIGKRVVGLVVEDVRGKNYRVQPGLIVQSK